MSVVLVERREHLAMLTINRPEVRNAVDRRVSIELGDALAEADDDPAVRVIVLTGAGDAAFCAGADLGAIARGEPPLPDDPIRAARGFAGVTSHPISTPLIAAVNGAALGGGAEIVLACDLAVAAETARIGLPEVRRGIIAAGGGAFRLPCQIPRKLALELLFTGEPIGALRALELGLVNQVVPQADVAGAALDLARRIAENAPLAVQGTKRIAAQIDAGDAPEERDDWRRSIAELDAVMASEDLREGARSFLERRSPEWRSR